MSESPLWERSFLCTTNFLKFVFNLMREFAFDSALFSLWREELEKNKYSTLSAGTFKIACSSRLSTSSQRYLSSSSVSIILKSDNDDGVINWQFDFINNGSCCFISAVDFKDAPRRFLCATYSKEIKRNILCLSSQGDRGTSWILEFINRNTVKIRCQDYPSYLRWEAEESSSSVSLGELPSADDSSFDWVLESDNNSPKSNGCRIIKRTFPIYQEKDIPVPNGEADNFLLSERFIASEQASKTYEVTGPWYVGTCYGGYAGDKKFPLNYSTHFFRPAKRLHYLINVEVVEATNSLEIEATLFDARDHGWGSANGGNLYILVYPRDGGEAVELEKVYFGEILSAKLNRDNKVKGVEIKLKCFSSFTFFGGEIIAVCFDSTHSGCSVMIEQCVVTIRDARPPNVLETVFFHTISGHSYVDKVDPSDYFKEKYGAQDPKITRICQMRKDGRGIFQIWYANFGDALTILLVVLVFCILIPIRFPNVDSGYLILAFMVDAILMDELRAVEIVYSNVVADKASTMTVASICGLIAHRKCEYKTTEQLTDVLRKVYDDEVIDRIEFEANIFANLSLFIKVGSVISEFSLKIVSVFGVYAPLIASLPVLFSLSTFCALTYQMVKDVTSIDYSYVGEIELKSSGATPFQKKDWSFDLRMASEINPQKYLIMPDGYIIERAIFQRNIICFRILQLAKKGRGCELLQRSPLSALLHEKKRPSMLLLNVPNNWPLPVKSGFWLANPDDIQCCMSNLFMLKAMFSHNSFEMAARKIVEISGHKFGFEPQYLYLQRLFVSLLRKGQPRTFRSNVHLLESMKHGMLSKTPVQDNAQHLIDFIQQYVEYNGDSEEYFKLNKPSENDYYNFNAVWGFSNILLGSIWPDDLWLQTSNLWYPLLSGDLEPSKQMVGMHNIANTTCHISKPLSWGSVSNWTDGSTLLVPSKGTISLQEKGSTTSSSTIHDIVNLSHDRRILMAKGYICIVLKATKKLINILWSDGSEDIDLISSRSGYAQSQIIVLYVLIAVVVEGDVHGNCQRGDYNYWRSIVDEEEPAVINPDQSILYICVDLLASLTVGVCPTVTILHLDFAKEIRKDFHTPEFLFLANYCFIYKVVNSFRTARMAADTEEYHEFRGKSLVCFRLLGKLLEIPRYTQWENELLSSIEIRKKTKGSAKMIVVDGLEVDGLELWLDATARETVDLNGAHAVKRWRSMDGNGRVLTAKFGNPILHDGGTYPHPSIRMTVPAPVCIEFDFDKVMQIDPPMQAIQTIISVHRFKNCKDHMQYIFSGDEQSPLCGEKDTISGQHGVHAAGMPFNKADIRLNSGVGKPTVQTTAWTDEFKVASVVMSMGPVPTDRMGSRINRIGRDRNFHDFAGFLVEVLVWNRELSEKEVLAVESYLHSKHAIPTVAAI